MKKKWFNFFLFSVISACCFAQTDGYKFYCKLDSVKTSGFYNIEFTSELNALLKTDYSDIRIVNDSGKWVPHVLHVTVYENTGKAVSRNLKFSMSENTASNTELIIEKGENIMSGLGLMISNTAAERFCTLSGSNDKNNWFVINDSILLHPIPDDNATENIMNINFPASSYLYYKIVIHNRNKDPFNIKAVVANTAITYPLKKIINNPSTQLIQKDSGKISYIKVIQQQPYQFDFINLQLSGVKYYNRQVELYVPLDAVHSFSNPGRLLHTFMASNNSTLQFKIPLTKTIVFYLLIKNEDNLLLVVDTVTTSCSHHYITAYLEKGNSYRLITDNQKALLPEYDLSNLTTKIPDSITSLGFGKLIAFHEPKDDLTKANNNKWFLWASIAAALVILLVFTTKMMKEVDKRKTT